MIYEKLPYEQRADGDLGVPPCADLDSLSPLEAHTPAKVEGILCCGLTQPRSRQRILDIAMPSLTHLVRQATDWGEAPENEGRLGDFRFLILNVRTASGIDAYVQLWSEARGDVIIEVGPGDRPDPQLQAFADEIREALLDRGFQIGGNANNFRKALALPVGGDAGKFAREMAAVVVDVLGYDGTVDLGCRLEQGSDLSEGRVLSGVSRYALRALMEAWGLRPSIPADEKDVLDAQNLYRTFRIQLFCPQAHRKDHFWEVHCIAWVTLRPDRAATLIDNVNGRPCLLKAYAVAGATATEQEVRLSLGINLAGGVTPTHIRDQIFEFLALVRKLPEQMG
jgi:hypothetical protein